MGDESAIGKEIAELSRAHPSFLKTGKRAACCLDDGNFASCEIPRFNERALATENARLRNAQKVGFAT
jgi:hypothetical protein